MHGIHGQCSNYRKHFVRVRQPQVATGGLIGCIKPYEYAEDLGDDDYSDVQPSTKFKKEFPDGNVPIRYVHRSDRTADFFEWADETLAMTEALHSSVSRPVDELEELREQYLNTPLKKVPLRKQIISQLMQAGLTLRQIARYVCRPDYEIVITITQGSNPEKIAAVLAVDEMIHASASPKDGGLDGTPLNVAATGRELGLAHTTIEALQRFRGVGPLTRAERDAFDQRLIHLRLEGCTWRVITEVLDAEFPDQKVTYNRIVQWSKPERMKRGCDRFGLPIPCSEQRSEQPNADAA